MTLIGRMSADKLILIIKPNMDIIEKKKSNFKRYIKDSWILILAVAIIFVVDILSITRMYKNDDLQGVTYLFLAVAFGYTCIKGAKRLQQEGKEYGYYAPIIFVGGIFSAVWIGQAFELFFK